MCSATNKIFAAIEAGGTKFNCVIADSDNRILSEARFPTTTPEKTLKECSLFFQQQAKVHGLPYSLGIACFGPVELDTTAPNWGYITKTPKPHWSNTEIAGFFERELKIPVAFDTDTNGAALGEANYGAGKGLKNFVYVTVGTGIGAGVFVDGRLINGESHTEIGHMLIGKHPEDTYSGHCPFHSDCLTSLACGPALEARWNLPARDLSADHQAWEIQSHYLAVMCVNLTLNYAPSKITLGGGVMDQLHLFEKIRKKYLTLMNGYMLPKTPIDEFIVPSENSGSSGVWGALQLAKMIT